MVLLPASDLDRPVELFEEDHPRERVRQGYGSEGEEIVGPSEHFRGEPERSAEHEGNVAAARGTKGAEFSREIFRGERFSSYPIQGYSVGSVRETLEEALALRREHLFGRATVHVFFRDLDDLDREVTSEPGKVIVASLGRPTLQSPDGDDGGAPDHSVSKSCPLPRCS